MVWINFLLLLTTVAFAQEELPKFLTKHSIDTIRFISMDGRYAYVRKRPGVLGMVSSFKSMDFLSDAQTSDFLMKGTNSKRRLVIEVIPQVHGEYDFFKKNRLAFVDWGNTVVKEIGEGINAKLHQSDEWVSYFHPIDKTLTLQNLITQKKFTIQLQAKMNPFFRPEVEMVSSDSVLYTDINDQGYAALIGYNFLTQKSTVLYKAPQNATRLELCSDGNYIGIGEFPYEGVNRGSKILFLKDRNTANYAGYSTIYTSVDQDLGNMICSSKGIYFIKTMSQDKKLGSKVTEVVRLDTVTNKVEAKTSLKHVTQIIEMDGRILIPDRGDYWVLEGRANISDDTLKSAPSRKEELPLDL